jgi:NAD(P)-dependent dehydrogenase (short-subunit alcohol dehydrogenase family)
MTNNTQEITGEEVLQPEKSTILSLVKTVPQEYPNLRCRGIDILLPVPGSPQEDRLPDRLLEELTAESPSTLVAYRNNHRWVQTYEPVCLKNPETGIPRLRQKGVYLVTGGLGNIGFILAKYLVEHYAARLILTGRSPLPDRTQWEQILETDHSHDPMKKKILAVLELEKQGGEVLYFGADAANREQMQQVIFRAEEQFGRLNGVIHAAGTFEAGTFQPVNATAKSQCEKHFQPKVYGLLALDELLRHKVLDFCLLTSSLSPILGGLGFTAYAAANLFMDAFVHKANKTSPLSWISVNWADWQFGQETGRPLLGARLTKLNITPDEGVETFKRILYHCKENQVVISAGELQTRIDQWIKLDTVKGKSETHPGNKGLHPLDSRKDLTSTYLAPRNPLEKELVDIWQELLGISGIGVRDNFFELGGDSLLGITLINRLKELLGEIVHITIIFDAATVEQLAAHITQHYPQVAARLMGTAPEKLREYRNNSPLPEIKQIDRSDTFQILEQIDQYSDEEVNIMLKQMLEKEEEENL